MDHPDPAPAKSHAREQLSSTLSSTPSITLRFAGTRSPFVSTTRLPTTSYLAGKWSWARLSRSTVQVCGTRSAGFSGKRERYDGQPGWIARKGVLGRR